MKSLGSMSVDMAELKYSQRLSLLEIQGSGKKISIELDRGTAEYLFSYLAKFLKNEESSVAQLRRGLMLENQP